ncbi:ketosteroid isomerase-like protein [Novosphingobium chloroacetimidivorans]|uniref:Ketosteroid isomerase-like protein n=1 Tax=Novosphingobium chloroacetimidivorans TaxID=1428314 RepID=A0A7W7KBC5_9SPHN|nr:nuclear transport factor 2 family protein [Novosphingobium chloroacetimidivorans]MBB4859351.1 ketosteroid isomerase-like protein [Novosphingobium chloroacetimidivorans]
MSPTIVAMAVLLAAVPPAAAAAAPQARLAASSPEAGNRAFIREAFERWAAGDADFFDLLVDDVTWHIAGFDPVVARTYHGRQALLDGAVRPLAARLTGTLRPTVRRIWADGDDVIVHWDGEAAVYDGTRYRNTYLWILTVKDRRIVAVTAFLDNAAFKAVLDKPAPDPSRRPGSRRE